MKGLVKRHRLLTYMASLGLILAFSVSFAMISNNSTYSILEAMNVNAEGDDTLGAKAEPEVPPQPVDLPFPYEDKQGYPRENLESPTGLRLKPPTNLKTEIEYNPETREYDVYEKTGAFETSTPYSMSQNEYNDYNSKNSRKKYWKGRSSDNRRGKEDASQPSLTPGIDKFLGDNKIDIKPQGSVEITMGGKFSRTYNPSLPKRQQRNNSFDFNNKIQMSVTGNIADRVMLRIKYDSESQFEFENEYKLEYTGDEDEIIKKIELGMVSFPLNNTLITGSQSLLGVKTELQFGKLYVTSVFSQQRGEFSTINVEKGAQKQEYEVRCDDYDANKHFFLGYYFRSKYEKAFETMPQISNGVIIKRVEIWMTQTSTGKENARNILAVAELGDKQTGINNYDLPNNNSDKLYKSLKSNTLLRNISMVTSAMQSVTSALTGRNLVAGQDYEKIELAIKLKENQYTVNSKLGYISLRTPIDPSKVLAVAYEYEFRGKTYQVGEFSSDGIDPPNTLIVKLLKGTQLNPRLHTWDLMMKNIYSIGGYQMSSEDFKLDILYEDDRTGKPLGYIPEGKIKGKPILSVMNLDTISNDNQPYSDGYFDYLEGFTVNSSQGLIIFPVLEPFGSHLESVFGESVVEKDLASRYTYKELYDSTQSSARQVAEKNKYLLKGSYKSSQSSEISLNATQVEEGSVVVTAGGRKLIENVDYTVDYAMGKVKIINTGLLESGTPIKVSLESNPLFNMKRRTFMGTRLEYRFTENLNLGATIVRLNESPVTTKVGFEDFPIKNTVWGLDGSYTTPAPFLTRMVDKIPLISTKEKSTISTNAEFAQLIPGYSKKINDAIEIDYFENSERRISLREPGLWVLASAPQGQNRFKESALNNDRLYGANRAQLSWFDISSEYFYNSRSSEISEELQSQPYSHAVMETDLFPNRDAETYNNRPLTMINLGYYPYEPGPYNYDLTKTKYTAGIDLQTGRLLEPKSRWGGIMREMTTTDFEEANVEYIEFWLMDPFHGDSKREGGDMYFNLGLVSEDILRDSRKFAENGLKNDTGDFSYTAWGRVPNFQVVEKGFDNNAKREDQDVGFDGFADDDEKVYFGEYLEKLKNTSVYDKIYKDPSHDNFVSYMSDRGIDTLSIFERYRYYNGVEGNSPTNNSQGTGKITPDIEDVNQDNTLQETESYFQYKVSIRREDLEIGKNFVVDKITESVKTPDGNRHKINWYQLKIPINTAEKQSIGAISDFKSIQFMRVFLTNFADSIYLRMAELGLVRSDWRKYDNALFDAGEYDMTNDAAFDVTSVNLEENSNRRPVNYVLPPGVERTIDPMNSQVKQQNESSLMLKVEDLQDGHSKAVYKMLNKDLRQFGFIKMFAHAEALQNKVNVTNDGDLCAFVRIGSDYTKNYYEYEVPLVLTPHLQDGEKDYDGSAGDRKVVWPEENEFTVDLKKLVELKENRNKKIIDAKFKGIQTYQVYSEKDSTNTISVKGNPNLGNVKTIMLGVRNKKRNSNKGKDDGQDKSVIIWFDELRLTDFNDKGGWAAAASTRMTMADFATVSLSGKTIKPGFGALDQKIFDRSQEDIKQYDLATNMALNKFFPEKLGLQLPFYFGWSESFTTPLYDPLDPDIKLKRKINSLPSDSMKDYRFMTVEYENRLSYNFTNVRIVRPSPKFLHPLHVNNISLTYAFNKIHARDIEYEYEDTYENKLYLMYTYPIKSKNYEPLRKYIKTPQLALIRDFNFYLLPQSVTFDNQFTKQYKESRRRNISTYADPNYKFSPMYSKMFGWERIYNVKYSMTKNLKFDYNATNTAKIDEPRGKIYHDNDHKPYMKSYRDSVYVNLQNGGKTTDFNQRLDATYRLPIDKIQQLNWITSNYRYGGNYTWTRGYELSSEYADFNTGNEIKNSNTHTLDGTFSMSKLYNKSAYLKEVDKKYSRQQKPKNKIENVTYNQSGLNVLAFEELTIKHNLNTTDVKLSVLDSKGQMITGTTKILDKNTVSFVAERDYEGASVLVNGKREVKTPPGKSITDRVVYTLMMVKNINITGTMNNGSFVPGYRHNTKYFGLYDPFDRPNRRPSWAYVFGYVPAVDTLEGQILGDHWLVDNDSLLNDKFTRTYSDQIRVKTSLEPIPTLKITLDNQRMYSKNHTRFLSNNEETMRYSKRTTSGNFSISSNTLKSNELLKKGASDDAYERFKVNRITIAKRLAEQRGESYEINPRTKYPSFYKATSQDVLIPAFVAAYTGQDANKVEANNYFIPLFKSFKDFARAINWKVQYSGLSGVKFVKKYFKSVNINHGYDCMYSIGSYETFSSTSMIDEEFYSDLIDGNVYLAPRYNISTVSFNERFNPIIGIDTKLNNNITTKFEVRNNRNVSLSLVNTEISETMGSEWIMGVGYVFKDVTINVKTAGSTKSYTNDVNTRIDFSIRNTNTIRRTIADDRKHVIAGQRIYSVKWFADYQMTERFNIRLYADWALNKPRTNGYKTRNLNVGVTFRITLI